MSEIKKIATRESYGNALVEVGKEHEDLIVLDADLAGATKTGAGAQLDWISTSECQDRCNSRRYLRW